MSFSIYDASAPVFVAALTNMQAWLDKSLAEGKDEKALMEARLAPDMAPLSGQVQLASDAAKSGAARLAGVAAPSFPDTETTWAEFKDRVAKTLAFVDSVDRAAIDGGDENRIIELKTPSRTLSFTARDFLLQFSLPNFHFHVVTAYGLLRAAGVPLGKLDYLAGGRPEALAA